MPTISISTIESQVIALKDYMTPKMTGFILFFAMCALPVSLYRTTQINWLDIPTLLHFSIYPLALILFIVRYRISHKVAIYYLLYTSLVLSSTDFLNFGFMGIGELAGAFAIMLSLFYLDKRTTLLVAGAVTVFYLISMSRFVFQQASLPLEGSALLQSPLSWIGIYYSAGVFFFFIGVCTKCTHKKMISYSTALRQQSLKIEAQTREIEYLANHDALTGLPSYRVAGDKLQQAMDNAKQHELQCALLFMDLDGFKAINDTYGHEAGDVLLKTIAGRIQEVISPNDTACRLGGDEFLIVVGEIKQLNTLHSLCQALLAEIPKPYSHRNAQLSVGVSIGAAVYPDCADNSNDLRAMSDKLMYQVKKHGKNNYQIASKPVATKEPQPEAVVG